MDDRVDWAAEQEKWQQLMGIRDEVLRVLERLRQEKVIASNQEASVAINCDEPDAGLLREFGLEQSATLCIVSKVKLQQAVCETSVSPQKSEFEKCGQCWNHWLSLGTDVEAMDLCERRAHVVRRQK